jgi:hypothetical protein
MISTDEEFSFIPVHRYFTGRAGSAFLPVATPKLAMFVPEVCAEALGFIFQNVLLASPSYLEGLRRIVGANR